MALLIAYKALLIAYRAVFMKCMALLSAATGCRLQVFWHEEMPAERDRAFLIVYRALFDGVWGSFDRV